MEFTNSPLVTYTNITNHKTSPRKKAIDTITIHCIVGQWTAKQGCDYFATTDRECSANYVVGKDGSIGLSVDEKDRSWCSSSSANDNRAITIEVASDTKAPYAVTDAAYNALIQLVADICKRNNIKKLVWSTEKDDRVNHKNGCNMTVHRDYANKSCPGEYLYERHGDIAAKVNEILNAGETKEETKSDVLYRVQVGAFKNKVYADAMLEKVQAAGFNAFITTKGGQAVSTAAPVVKKEIKVGSTVRLKKGAKTYTGGNLASFVYNRDHKVKQISVDRVVITFNNIVVAAVKKSDLTLVE